MKAITHENIDLETETPFPHDLMQGAGPDKDYVYLDLTHLPKEQIEAKLPDITDIILHMKNEMSAQPPLRTTTVRQHKEERLAKG